MSIPSLTDRTVRGSDAVDALWNLLASPTIDPATLARAIETVLAQPNLDWRTLQLVEEGWEALEQSIEPPLLNENLCERTDIEIKEAIRARTADVSKSHCDVKFPSLKERLMPHLSPITVCQFLRELRIGTSSMATISVSTSRRGRARGASQGCSGEGDRTNPYSTQWPLLSVSDPSPSHV